MPNSNTTIGLKTKALKQRLVYSYLSLAGVGLGLLIVGLIANLWLRTYALEVIEVSAPKIELLEKINIGLQSSRVHLHSWVSDKNPHHHFSRKAAWNNLIYPSLQGLKNSNNKQSQIKQIQVLKEDLKNLEMWQWHIEDIAQTPGNQPSKLLYDSQIQAIILDIVTSTSALIDYQSDNIKQKDYSASMNHLIQLRTSVFLSNNHLQNYLSEANSYNRHAFSTLINKADIAQQFLMEQKKTASREVDEQLSLLNSAFSAYKLLSAKAFDTRASKKWNVALFWLDQTMLPLSKKVESQLNTLLDKEKQQLKTYAETIQWLGYSVPIIMLVLMLVMIITVFYLAKIGIKQFVGPVILLEQQHRLKGDLALLSRKMMAASTLKQLCESIVDSISSTMQASASTLFIEKNHELQLAAGYARPKNKPLELAAIKPGEGIIGQVYTSNKTMVLKTDTIEDFTIQSSLIEIKPNTLMVSPISYEDRVIAVLELASLHEFTKYQINFLESSLKEIGISLNATQQKETIREQLATSQKQAEKLQSQQDQLRISNEALEQKGAALKQQSIDLEKSNTELSEKSDSLQSQALMLIKSQTETEEKARQLEISGKYKSEFLANMSHELRTPLNSLLILAKMLAENDEENLTQEQVESALVIHDSGSHLLNLINDILDLSKIEAGRMDVTKETVNISDLAQSMSLRFQHMAKEKAIDFLVQGLDNPIQNIVSDGIKVEQIITNLIGNAIKFTQEGHVILRFNVADDNRLAIEVEDTGIGIDKEKQSAIFESFQQEDGSTSRTFGGTGLGLSISVAYARLLGGEIQLLSTKNQGSVFTIYLPLQIPSTNQLIDKQQPHSIEPSTAIKKQQPDLEKQWKLSPPPFTDDRDSVEKNCPLILIIEDDLDFSRILFNEAKSHGYQSLVAIDAESGLILLKQHQVSGILLDLTLPRMDGRELLNLIKADDESKHIPIHIISALDNLGDEMTQDTVGYFTKPISKIQIDQALDRLLHFADNRKHKILLIEDDTNTQLAISKLLNNQQLDITEVGLAAQATQALKSMLFDTVILDLGLPDKNGLDWLEEIEKEQKIVMPPIIIYSGYELNDKEEQRLKKFTDRIILKSERSEERLLSEVSLFLQAIKKPSSTVEPKTLSKQEILKLKEKRILVVDDDMRNTFALSKALRTKGMIVEMAGGGQQALDKLQRSEQFDVVLMDIMMPEMNGYETIQKIRKNTHFHDLSIIAVTAKAMKDDKEKCLSAGANDYLSKPIDMHELQSTLLTWL